MTGMNLPTFDQRAITFAKIKARRIKLLVPSVIVLVSEHKKQALGFDLAATAQELSQQAWAERCQTFKDHIEVVETLILREFVYGFKYRTLWCRHDQLPIVRGDDLIVAGTFSQSERRIRKKCSFPGYDCAIERELGEPFGNIRAIHPDLSILTKRQIMAVPLLRQSAHTSKMQALLHDVLH